jgi:hypothetical protein
MPVNRSGKHCESSELAHDRTYTDGHHAAPRDAARPAHRPACDRAADRGHHQGKHQCERRYHQYRSVSRRYDSERRHEPGQHGIQDHDHSGYRLRRPLVALIEFPALPAAQPGEHGRSPKAGGSQVGCVSGAHQTQTPPGTAMSGHGRGHRINGWLCGTVDNATRIA